MTFKELYTTEAIKIIVSADKELSVEDKEAELNKIVVSSDAYLQAEMIEKLNRNLEALRISNLVRR